MTSPTYDEATPSRSDVDRLHRAHHLPSSASSPLVHIGIQSFERLERLQFTFGNDIVQGRLKLMCFFIGYQCVVVLLRFCAVGQSCSLV